MKISARIVTVYSLVSRTGSYAGRVDASGVKLAWGRINEKRGVLPEQHTAGRGTVNMNRWGYCIQLSLVKGAVVLPEMSILGI